MANKRLMCEFFLVRYVPDVVKGEFVNVGVVLREVGASQKAIVRFTRDWRRVRCIDPMADIEMLETLEGELSSRLSSEERTERSLLDLLGDDLSNSVQLTPARSCLAETIPAEIDLLMRMYVEPLDARKQRQVGGRAAIAGRMRREFERIGAWDLMRKSIAAAQYTRAGDPMRIDCGYRLTGKVRLFQAVSLESDVESAKVLAYSAPELRAGVQRVEGEELALTAVVEPVRNLEGVEDLLERYRFGVEAMERAEIRVMTTADLRRMAETARMELHA